MTDTRLSSKGNIRVRWYPANGFANYLSPTVTELNAGLNIAKVISWNDWSFGIEASEVNDDPDITVKSNVGTRGRANYGGALSFYRAETHGDTGNQNFTVYDALRVPGTKGFLVLSIDGELSENNTPVYSGGAVQDFAAGDLVDVYGVETASWNDADTGDDAFRFTIGFLPKGELLRNGVARTSAAAVELTPATSSGAAGTFLALTGTLNGRRVTRSLNYTSSDHAVATVSANGIVTRVAAGTATITGTDPRSGASDTTALTVT